LQVLSPIDNWVLSAWDNEIVAIRGTVKQKATL